MDKQSLLEKIKSSDHLSADERSYLINLINTKKYGLVWEDKPEDAEELLRTHLPVLREVEERRITSPQPSPEGRESALNVTAANLQALKPENKATQTLLFEAEVNQIDSSTSKTKKIQNEQTGNLQNEQQLQQPNLPPLGGGLGRGVNHILIEGDNLHALTALTFTHEGKVDVIYIDPPYNTGNKDFKYNDTFVDKEDSFRHSKWLSFMDKRLKIAKRLLSDKGVVFISIDDNEQAQLKLLCDEVFGEANFIETYIWESTTRPDNSSKIFRKNAEFVLCIAKNRTEITEFKGLDFTRSGLPSLTKATMGVGLLLFKKEFVDCYLPDGVYKSGVKGEYELLNDVIVKEGKIQNDFSLKGRMIWGQSYLEKEIEKGTRIIIKTKGFVPYSKKSDDGIIRPPKLMQKEYVGDVLSANSEMNSVFGSRPFRYPKPITLIKYLIDYFKSKNLIILDFFAGSGTTLHATMQLNAEDGGNRQCILVTNNENNICEEVTYERNKRVIQGYTNTKGVPVAGLANNNLRYYRTEFVGRERSLKNKRLLVQAATQMLCVKEDIYTEITEVVGVTINKNNYRCFTDNEHYLLVIYNEEVIEELVPLIAKIESKHKIKIYVFAPGQYPYTEEFEDVLPKVELCALPDAIYKAYANVLPKKKVE